VYKVFVTVDEKSKELYTELYPKTLNPIDTTRVPGGTSSGSAAAVAAGMCMFAIGTDTGGSVRMPANFCGVYGMKCTHGYLSRSGLIAAASSLEGAGILANSIDDVKTVYEVLSSADPMDNTSVPTEKREEIKNNSNYKKVVIYPEEYVNAKGIGDDTKKDFYDSLEKIKKSWIRSSSCKF
jgi:aspartyl-tRNA(Asn)/glutamyl-tRNA(Gln) amidotransferase subunit A